MILGIEAPDTGLSNTESLALVACFVLTVAALFVGFFVGGQYATMKDRLDSIEDRLTPSFADEHHEEGVEQYPEVSLVSRRIDHGPTPRPSPVPRNQPAEEETDEFPAVPATEPNGMPLAVENDKLKNERQPPAYTGTEYRTFTRADGSEARFEIRKPE